MKQVVILAGGKGNRLRERLGGLPKPLIDICGKPLLERQIELVKRYGYTHVLLLVSYAAQQIREFCASRNNWGVRIDCIDDGVPLGTAGAMLAVLEYLEEEFLVLYGDTMLEIDLTRFHAFHRSIPNVSTTLFLHPNDHPQDSDLVEIDAAGRITAFHPYPHNVHCHYQNLVNAALYYMRRTALVPWRCLTGPLDFGKDIFPAMLERGQVLLGYKSPEYIKDCGTPKRLDKVCADVASGLVANASLDVEQQAVFLDRDGTMIREVNHLSHHAQLELLPGVEEAIRRLNNSSYRSIVITNQPVMAHGDCSTSDLRLIHNKMETLLGLKGAYVDSIHYCPHHPDGGFPGEIAELKITCDCRKPNTGMIDEAVAELNISRGRSWLIGDTTTDMLTARNAGLKSILVETGYAGLDEKYWVAPDFIVPDLAAAVSLILDTYPALVRYIESLLQDIRLGDVLFVGGQSRSGKGSFANTMRHVLESQGLSCHVLSTDCWLLNESERGVGVLARHDIAKIGNVVMSVSDPEARPRQLKLPGYRRARRESVPDVRTVKLTSKDLVIFEGVVALHFAQLAGAKHRYFVESEENIRKQRVIREYLMRGLTMKAAESIYHERLAEEVPWIFATADNCIKVSIPTRFNDSDRKNNDHK
jgi:histidinol-phosphate phosphatase family protein